MRARKASARLLSVLPWFLPNLLAPFHLVEIPNTIKSTSRTSFILFLLSLNSSFFLFFFHFSFLICDIKIINVCSIFKGLVQKPNQLGCRIQWVDKLLAIMHVLERLAQLRVR